MPKLVTHSPSRCFRWLPTIAFASLAILLLCTNTPTARADERSSFDNDWRFQKGDAANAESLEFNDSGWRQLTLPHHW